MVFVKRPPPRRHASSIDRQVARLVHDRELIDLRQPSRVPAHVRGDRATLEHGLHVEDALDVLGVELGYGEQRPLLGVEEARAGVVLEHPLVPEDVDRRVRHHWGRILHGRTI